MRIGISGHQALPEAAVEYALAEIGRILSSTASPVDGFSSLAAGSDQIFAAELLSHYGALHVVLPSAEYESTFETREDRLRYEQFMAAASEIVHLPYPGPSEEAFLAAGLVIVERTDLLIAVWDGRPARGLGGTADVIKYARSVGKPVSVLWPPGVDR